MIETKIIKSPISKEEFQSLLLKEKDNFGMLKATVDIKKEIIAINCELHCDCAEQLYKIDSDWRDVWGINIYLSDKTIEYNSFINIRPQMNNSSMEIQDSDIKEKIDKIINKLIFNII